ncbi:hypothetical protein B0T13DRAFT_85924 [Neurospora crassa]|nr:hypothetical protein B0T13DRAFT_85924 [Neurospora crassa]
MLPMSTAEQQALFKRSSSVPLGSLQCRQNSPSTTPRNGHMLCLFTQQLHGGANCWLSDSALSFSAHSSRQRISVRGLADGCATCDIYTMLDAGKTFGEDETSSSWRSYDVTQGPLLFVKLSWHLHTLFRSPRLSTCFRQEPSPKTWYLYSYWNAQGRHQNQEPSGTEGPGLRSLLSLIIRPSLQRITPQKTASRREHQRSGQVFQVKLAISGRLGKVLLSPASARP